MKQVTAPQAAPDWVATKKTDKSGRFRVAVPVGMKIIASVSTGPFLPRSDKALEKFGNAPCAFLQNIVPAQEDGTVQVIRLSLISGRTPKTGGCVVDGK